MATAMAIAGCTGTDSEPTAITDPPGTAASPTTEQATTTTAEVTTTTADQTAAVEAAHIDSVEIWVECHRNLPDCDVETEFAKVFTGGTLDRLTAATLQRQADGLVYEPPDNPDHARTEILDITLNADQTKATVRACTFAGDKEFLIGDDGVRTAVGLNNTVTVSWGDGMFERGDDGVWRAYDFDLSTGGSVDVAVADVDQSEQEEDLCGSTDA